MGSEKDINMNALNDDDLESVAGGMGDVQPLVFTGKVPKAKATVQKGKAPKADSLVLKEKKGKKSIDGKLLSGDVIEKGRYC